MKQAFQRQGVNPPTQLSLATHGDVILGIAVSHMSGVTGATSTAQALRSLVSGDRAVGVGVLPSLRFHDEVLRGSRSEASPTAARGGSPPPCAPPDEPAHSAQPAMPEGASDPAPAGDASHDEGGLVEGSRAGVSAVEEQADVAAGDRPVIPDTVIDLVSMGPASSLGDDVVEVPGSPVLMNPGVAAVPVEDARGGAALEAMGSSAGAPMSRLRRLQALARLSHVRGILLLASVLRMSGMAILAALESMPRGFWRRLVVVRVVRALALVRAPP